MHRAYSLPLNSVPKTYQITRIAPMPVQVRQLQLVFINGLRMQFTPRELLRMFTRRRSISVILAWATLIFVIRPFEPAPGYAFEVRVLIWGTLLPLLIALYLGVLIALGQVFRTGYAALAHVLAAFCGGVLLPLYDRAFGAGRAEVAVLQVFLFLLIAGALLELVMATYLTHDDRLRQKSRPAAAAMAHPLRPASCPLAAATAPPPPQPEAEAQAATVGFDHEPALRAEPPGMGTTIAEDAAEIPEQPVPLFGRPVLLSELLLVSAEEHYVRLHSIGGQELLRGRISDIEAQLPDRLGRRVHRSHWVATAAVRRLHRKREGWMLELIDGTQIPVARPRRGAMRQWLEEAGIPT